MSRDMSLIWQMSVAGAAGALVSFSKTTQALKNVKDSTDDLVKSQKNLEKFDKVAESYKGVNSEYNKAVKNLESLRKAYLKSNNATAEFKKQIEDAEKHVDKLNKQKERQKHIFRAARSELEKEGIKLEGYKKKIEEVNAELKKQEKLKRDLSKAQAISDLGNQFSQKGSQQIKTGLTMAATLAIPVKLYMDLEESQADLRKILGKEAEKYYTDLAEISKNNPLSQVEINEIAGSLAQSGIKGDDIVAYTEMASKMKVAFDISTDEAGQFLAKTKEQLNLSKDDLYSYMDTINMLSNHYAVSAAQLSDVSGRTAGFAKTVNLSKEANMAFATSLISSNVNAEQTSTILSKLYAELSQGANTKAKAAALDFLGLDSKTINERMAKDAEGTILKVLERIKNAQGKDKSALISDIFGSHASVLNGISILSENLDGVKEKLVQAKKAVSENETVNAEYEERINTLTQQLKILKNTFMGALMDMGKSVAPELKETFETLKGWGISFGNFVKENPKLIATIIKIVASLALFNLTAGVTNKFAIAPLLKGFAWFEKFKAAKALGGFSNALKTMFPLTSKLIGLFGNLRRFLISSLKGLMFYASKIMMGFKMYFQGFLNIVIKISKFLSGKFISVIKTVGLAIKAAVTANPIGALIVAIIAVVAVFVYLYKKVEWFRDGVNKIFEGIKLYFGGIWDIIRGIFTGNFDLIKQGFQKMVDGLKVIWDGLVGIISKTWDKITSFFKKAKDETQGIKDMADKSQTTTPNIYENWTGTNYFTGGLTTLAERGPELVQVNNNSYLANSPTMTNLPKGSRILNNFQTKNIINNMPKVVSKKALSSTVGLLRERLSNINNTSNTKTIIGGDTITIQVIGTDKSSMDIAREVKRVLSELKSKKDRTVIA